MSGSPERERLTQELNCSPDEGLGIRDPRSSTGAFLPMEKLSSALGAFLIFYGRSMKTILLI